jgi:signal transduction histidine kinase
MPPEAAVEMAALQALGIRSRLQVPVVSSSGVLGMLAFSSLQRGYSWNPATASLMQIAGEMFGNAIQRRLADEEIRNGEAFARLSTELATGFINLPLERLDAGIEAAIRAIAEFCGADRALITRIEQSDRFVSVTHEWCADGLPRLGERLREMPAEAFPWMLEQIRTLDLVAASRLEDLPVHAVWEREFIRALGCRSGIALSLLSRNRVVTGAIQLFCVRERQWPDSAIAAVRLASGVLSNAIERRQTEAEARKHQSELAHVLRVGTMGELASGILHDVKQPLAAIAFYSRGCEERVKRGEMDGDELQAMFGRLTSLAVRTGAVVKQVREYVRREPEARKRHNLNDLIRRAVALVQPDAEQNRVSLRLNLTRKQLPVDVNPVQIEQVMINLLINGVEAIGQTTERSGEIRIETRPTEDDQAEVAVTDCGIGLPPADRLPNVFEPFVTTKHEGLGLGLAISRSLIESHGGQIWGRSRDDRRGATFGFTVPLSRG